MQVLDIKDYCMSKLGAYEDCPFGDVPICYNQKYTPMRLRKRPCEEIFAGLFTFRNKSIERISPAK